MADWIDKLKQGEDAEAMERDRQREWKLRCERIIRDRAPALWQSVIDRIKADVKRLAVVFPNDDSKKLAFEDCPLESGFTLTKHTYPTVHLRLRWMEDSTAVNLDWFTRHDQNSEGCRFTRFITFALNDRDDLKMVFEGREYMAAEELSQNLITSIIGR